MKKTSLYIIFGSVVLILTSLVYAALTTGSLGNVMIQEKLSPYGYEQTIATIRKNVKEQNWLIPKHYDFQKSLKKHNQPDCGRVTVFKLCQPEIAAELLANDRNKFVSVMMPCSVSVYEKDDGKTYVASINVDMMSKVMGSKMSPIFQRVADENGRILGFLDN